jgi:hypothetical protein
MLSKWMPWDFSKNYPYIFQENKIGVYGISFSDHYIEKLLLDSCRKASFVGEMKTVLGSELTIDWFEEEFKTLSLFGTQETYIVLEAQKINSKVQAFIFENISMFDERWILFSFNLSKKLDEWDKKIESGYFVNVTIPRFWEQTRYFEFLSHHLDFPLNTSVQNFILDRIEQTTESYLKVLNQLKLNFSVSKNLKINEVQDLIEITKFDTFKMASLYGEKKASAFYKNILDFKEDFELLRSFFAFMQGHLFKILDPAYIESKARPSKYDKEILNFSKIWSEKDLLKEMKLFGELEVEAKKRSPDLSQRIQLIYLNNL